MKLSAAKMSEWNLQELRELIGRIHGQGQLSKATIHIDSVHWKLQFAGYHWRTASNSFKDVFDNVPNEIGAFSVFKVMFGRGEESSKFYEARYIHEANIIACAQAIHSVADIISHVILDALAIDSVEKENLSLKVITKKIPDSALKDKIVRVSGLAEFRYLQDFVNTTKHVSLVGSQYSLDLTGQDEFPHGLKFKEFKFKDRTHHAKWSAKFLDELKVLSNEFVDIGQTINDHLSRRVQNGKAMPA